MTKQRRLERLEQSIAPEEPPMTFTLTVPPVGLTREQYNEWHRQRRAECEARGVFCFTLNLGDCNVRP